MQAPKLYEKLLTLLFELSVTLVQVAENKLVDLKVTKMIDYVLKFEKKEIF